MGLRLETLSPRAAWPVSVPAWLAVATPAMLAFRALAIACQAATILITWPLWQVRDSPPMLPALPLPAFDLGPVLLISLGLLLIRPVPGLVMHSGLLVYAMVIDQTRIQPEIVSLLFLLWGTLDSPTARGFARTHLIALWCYSGINKLLSPAFMTGTAQWILSGFPLPAPEWLLPYAGYLIALTELGVGLLAIVPRTRRLAAVIAFALHMGIFLDLSPLGHDWNPSVWPWNIALAFAGFALIAPWREGPRQSLRLARPMARPLIVLTLLAPAGFYVGLTDAYLAHNLYSSNTARALVVCPGGCRPDQEPGVTWQAFNVPLPPEHRLFAAYFARTCDPGDQMVITDSRWWFVRNGEQRRVLACPG